MVGAVTVGSRGRGVVHVVVVIVVEVGKVAVVALALGGAAEDGVGFCYFDEAG